MIEAQPCIPRVEENLQRHSLLRQSFPLSLQEIGPIHLRSYEKVCLRTGMKLYKDTVVYTSENRRCQQQTTDDANYLDFRVVRRTSFFIPALPPSLSESRTLLAAALFIVSGLEAAFGSNRAMSLAFSAF